MLILSTFLLTSRFYGWSQTGIALPSAQINFSDLGKMNAKDKKRQKRLAKLKKQKLRQLNKLMTNHLPPNELSGKNYTELLRLLNYTELDSLHQDLEMITVLNGDRTNINASVFRQPARDALNNGATQPESIISSQEFFSEAKMLRRNHISLDTVLHSQLDLDSLLQWENKTKINNPDQNADSSVVARIERRLESVIAAKMQGIDEMHQPDAFKRLNQPAMQQYIPEWEERVYRKPELPEEALEKALIQQYRDRKAKEWKSGLGIQEAENPKVEKDPVSSRFSIGGYMRFDASRNSIELTPSLTYSVNQKLVLGTGYQTNISLSGSDSLNTKGIRAFAQYYFRGTYFLHGESEWVQQNGDDENSGILKERNTYLGLGKSFKYKSINTSVIALYNFHAPSAIRKRSFTIRFGISISK